jgi:hypothetical protein
MPMGLFFFIVEQISELILSLVRGIYEISDLDILLDATRNVSSILHIEWPVVMEQRICLSNDIESFQYSHTLLSCTQWNGGKNLTDLKC